MLVVVLNDGETYTDIKGCKLLYISPAAEDVSEMDEMIREMIEEGQGRELAYIIDYSRVTDKIRYELLKLSQ